jgi:ATP-binding cassette subfamily B protein
MAFITYTIQIIMAFLILSFASIMIPRAIVSIKRIIGVLNSKTSIEDPLKELPLDKKKRGIVEFQDVYFRYPDANEDVIHNISFKAYPKTTTAFIGSTGSGKSTLINLIPRLFDVTAGKILIDGVNIKDIKLKTLRKKIGYVPQKGVLFSGTIDSNIKLGNDNLSENEVKEVAKISQSLDFILEKEKNFKENVSQGGTNLSGGQKQRLSIARALAINSDILIFDDSFSALDYKTDVKLRKELFKKMNDKTILIVAQRIGTIINADQIIVLDNGEIVAIGKHKDLMKNCKVYKEIALSQLSKEELENA